MKCPNGEERTKQEMRDIFSGVSAGKEDSIDQLLSLVSRPGIKKDCANCVYHQINGDPNLHCYMFKGEPSGEMCGQFKKG